MPVGYDLRRVPRWLLMNNSYLSILCSSPSVVVLSNDLHRAVGRWVFRHNLRYLRVHTLTNDYLLPTEIFFPPTNQMTVTVLLETRNFRRWTIPQHHVYEAG